MKANNRVELLAGTNYTLYICSLTGCSKFLLWRGGRKWKEKSQMVSSLERVWKRFSQTNWLPTRNENVGSQTFIYKESQSTHTMGLSEERLNEASYTHSQLQNNPKLRHAVTLRLIFSNTRSRLRDLTESRAAIAAAPLGLIHADKQALSNLISRSLFLSLSLSISPSCFPTLSPPSSGFYSNTRSLWHLPGFALISPQTHEM